MKEYEEYVKLCDSISPTTAKENACKSVKHTLETLAKSFSKHVPYDKASKHWQDITNAITYFINKKMLAIQLVKSECFTEPKFLKPRYQVPGSQIFWPNCSTKLI
ncbi:hypothetical protein AMECASPLE_032982 [Ameca splendens]|uniref:Uncharacterized protein n=1 Tax=Ameca splendens TaxID=208324 RepID=A0ABV0Z4Y1_9TELE